MPLITELKEDRGEERAEEKEGEERRKIVIRWDEEARQMYRENTEKVIWEEERAEEHSIEDTWQRLKKLVKVSIIKEEKKVKKKELGFKDWWDKECTKRKG